jgi:hypothetical protein
MWQKEENRQDPCMQEYTDVREKCGLMYSGWKYEFSPKNEVKSKT